MGLISRQKLGKNGKEWKVPFKERKITERTERKRTRCPTLYEVGLQKVPRGLGLNRNTILDCNNALFRTYFILGLKFSMAVLHLCEFNIYVIMWFFEKNIFTNSPV